MAFPFVSTEVPVRHCLSLAGGPPVRDTRRMAKSPKRPRDPNQLAKMIMELTTQTTTEPKPKRKPARPKAAVKRTARN
jgi:hypothetical protein